MDELTIHNPQISAAVRGVGVAVPYLTEWFGLWAMEERVGQALAQRLGTIDLGAHMLSPQAATAMAAGDSQSYGYQIEEGGVAIADLRGVLMKQVPSGTSGTSTVMMRRTVRAMRADERVNAALFRVDSPGGTSAGMADLAADIAALAAVKPTVMFAEDLMASAAYGIAAGATRIAANPGAMVGSIGTYAVVQDMSARAAMEGIRVHVIKAGAFKGAGVAGTSVTPEQLADWQRLVDGSNELFLQGIAAGRRMNLERVRELADGRLHLAADARQLGLIDQVASFDQVLAELQQQLKTKRGGGRSVATTHTAPQGPMRKETVMVGDNTSNAPGGASGAATEDPQSQGSQTQGTQSQQGTQPGRVPATVAQIRAGCPGATNDFVVQQLEAGATLDDARTAWMAHLAAQVAVGHTAAGGGAGAVKPLGGAPIPRTTTQLAAGGDAIERFDAAVREAMSTENLSRRAAVLAVAKRDPQLHDEYLLATNPKRRQRELIQDRRECEG